MPSDGDLVVCPGRDHGLVPGDRAAVLGTVEDLALGGMSPTPEARPLAHAMGRIRRLRRGLIGLLQEDNKALTYAVSAVFALILVSTAVLRLSYRMPKGRGHLDLLSSLYFTVETVATVGYGDYTFAAQPTWLKVFAIVVILLGVALVSVAFALFTNLLVGRRIERSLGRRQVSGMVNHIVVIGLGAVGISVVTGLVAEGQRVVVIERDANNRYLAPGPCAGGAGDHRRRHPVADPSHGQPR